MFTPQQRRQLIELWLSANDGAATDEQLSRLSQSIERESEARQCILELTNQQGWLTWNAANLHPAAATGALAQSLGQELSIPDIGTPRGAPLTPTERQPAWVRAGDAWRRIGSRLAGFGAAAAAGVIALACLAGYLVGRRIASDEAPTVVAAPLRATMVSSTGCIWGPGNTVKRLTDERFASGDALQLLEGIAELRINRGAGYVQLQLEGPASAVLTGRGTPIISYGKMVAKADARQGESYPIETSFGRVQIEPSSEVGLAAFGSSAEIHCFRGRATVESPWLRSNSKEIGSASIKAGESLHLTDVGGATLEGRRSDANKERFTPQVSMSTDFLSVGVDYVREVMHAKPVAYWRFEEPTGHVARNEMGDEHHGQLKGNVQRVGAQGNRALSLGFDPHPGSLVAAGSWDDVLASSFSIETWIKPSHFHTGSIVGFVGDFDPSLQRNRHGVLLETCGPSSPRGWAQPKELRFLHRSQLTADSRHGVSVFSGRPYEARRWQHVVAVKDGSELRLFVDGELMQTAHENHPTPKGLHMVIGQLYTDSIERYFIGQLDETAIYDRPLTEFEVRRHHELLRPALRDDPSI